MAIYQTIEYPSDQKATDTEKARALLTGMGAVLSDDFECVGMPHVSFGDHLQNNDAPFDLTPFKGRLVLGGKLICADIFHVPGGQTRITINRWGEGPEQAGKLVVGKSDINCLSVVTYAGVTIGDNVHFDPRVTIMDSPGHPTDRRLPDIPENKKMAPVTIEDDAWIGYASTILPGVTIGKGAVVKPGSVVMWSVPPGGVVGGNPAKAMKIYKKHFQSQ